MAKLQCVAFLFLASVITLLAQQVTPGAQDSGQQAPPVSSRTLIPRSRQERESIYQAHHRVTLNVQVTDAAGAPVTGLTQEDFSLLDGDEPRKIAAFHVVQPGQPGGHVHTILLLDAVNNTSRIVARERKEMEKFLALNNGQLTYPTSVGVLTEAGLTVSPPSGDGNSLIADLDKLSSGVRTVSCAEESSNIGAESAGADGNVVTGDGLAALRSESTLSRLGNCENRKFKVSIAQLNRLAQQQTDTPGRALLIWIGPGWPRLTGPEFRPDTGAAKRAFFDYLVQLSGALQEAQITLDAVATPDALRLEEPVKGSEGAVFETVTSEDEASAASFALQILARQTGGQLRNDNKDLAAKISACIADAGSYYALAFDSAPAKEAGEYRPVEVRVSKPGPTIRTRAGYYAQP